MAEEVVAALEGRTVAVAEADWPRYHAAAVIAANHLVALLGQVERVAAERRRAARGLPVPGAEAASTMWWRSGPLPRSPGRCAAGDRATVERHLAALPAEERTAYAALSEEAARLCP